jgi:hypothetical protein
VTEPSAGKYAAKHPPDTPRDPAIAAALVRRVDEGRVACAVAHHVAEELGVVPAEVGKTADLLELRICLCQMGLFGYFPKKRLVKPAPEVDEGLREQLLGVVDDGTIRCAACWGIAKKTGLSKLAVACACETLDLKIRDCQLGAF